MDGQLSLKCYLDALDSCYTAYQAKYAKFANAQNRKVVNGAAANDSDNSRIDNLPLDDFNHIVFHSPTCKLVSKAYARLLCNDHLTEPSHPEFNSVPAETLKVPRDQSFADKAVEKFFMNLAKQRFEQRVQPSLQLPTLCGNMYCASVYGALISLICGVWMDPRCRASGSERTVTGKDQQLLSLA